jgi:ribonuclease III
MAPDIVQGEEELDLLEAALGCRFHDRRQLVQALTHRSHSSERSTDAAASDNEKLEFLGDAVLGMIVSAELVRAFPSWSEGQLSKSRSRFVNEASLAGAARQLDFGRHLRLGRGEEKTGGRQKSALLADAFEAVLAAIYLDSGLAAATDFVRRVLLTGAIEVEAIRRGGSDFKSALQEGLQAQGHTAAIYRVVEEKGPDHRKVFLVEARAGQLVATGSGSTKKEAEQAAARAILEMMVAGPAEESANGE